MLPLIDMLNHATCGSDEHNTGVEFAQQSGAIATTSKPVPKVNDHASGARAGLWREGAGEIVGSLWLLSVSGSVTVAEFACFCPSRRAPSCYWGHMNRGDL